MNTDAARLKAIDEAYAALVEATKVLQQAKEAYRAAKAAHDEAQHALNCAISADYRTLFDDDEEE